MIEAYIQTILLIIAVGIVIVISGYWLIKQVWHMI